MEEKTIKKLKEEPKEEPKEESKEESKEEPKEELREDNKHKELYKKLSKEIPKEYLFEYQDGNQILTGYKSQYAINLLNDILGIGDWTTEEKVLKQETLKRGWTVAMSIELYLADYGITVTGYGAHYSNNIANAYKGAKTSAFKNACRYLGIGKELHIKTDDDVVATQVAEEDLPSEQEKLANKIKQAKSLEELETLLPQINNTDGDAVKKVLIKKYNGRKIELTD